MRSELTLMPEETWLENRVNKMAIKEIHFVKQLPEKIKICDEWNPTVSENGLAKAVLTNDNKLYISTEGNECVYANKDSFIVFAGARQCHTIDGLELLDVSNAKNLCGMFFDVGSKAKKLKISGMENWDTSNVESMSLMFDSTGAEAIEWNIGDISKWNTSKVKHMDFMFNHAGRNAIKFEIGDISGWDVSSVKEIQNMFNKAGDRAVWTQNLQGWKVNQCWLHQNFQDNKKIIEPKWEDLDWLTP